ncbi:MAG: carboxylating nicotinate-nucleotide diphosphorylase [Oscillospiraceae bacterium]|nr:carboxylating nicotinate-nucleotide diphosphorylase [Oscillospiraceae bacterium]
MSDVTMRLDMDPYILSALREDINSGDVSADAVLPEKKRAAVDLICKQSGVVAGLCVFSRVFELLDDSFVFSPNCSDGDFIENGALVATMEGDAKALLSGERTALNYLQRMSGIATSTRHMAKLLEGTKIKLLDTRKTTPNMRIFEKYAVSVGGGFNHRYNLSSGVMLKDNHIGAAGSVRRAVELAKAHAPFVLKIEVEVENLDMAREAADAGADIIMLDNMDAETMKEAVALIAGRAETECSGNVTMERIAELRDVGVDYISSGALTHSAPIMDLSMKHLHLL